MEKQIAATWKRYLGNIIDYAFMYLFFYFYIRYFGNPTTDGYEISGLIALPIPLFWFLYFILMESVNEATLGYQALGLRIVTIDNKRVGLKEVLKASHT